MTALVFDERDALPYAAREMRRAPVIKDPTLDRGAQGTRLALLLATVIGSGGVTGCGAPQANPVDFRRAERAVFSAGGQDGVVERLFGAIRPKHRYLVELGAGNGTAGSHSRNLIQNHGWRGLLIEPRPEPAAALHQVYVDAAGVQTRHAGIYPGDIEMILKDANVPQDPDLLVVTLQGNDWYVWRAIQDFRPRVVQIEYNAAFVPPQPMVIDYHPLNYWDGSLYFGASIQSLFELGQRKGYELVYADQGGTTLFFVDRPYYSLFGLTENDPGSLFVPRAGFPRIEAATLWRFVRPDGRPWEEQATELVVKDVRIPRTFVVGERP